MTENKIESMFRVEEDWGEDFSCCREFVYKYEVIKETKCGVWIALNRHAGKKRFVNLNSVKKYAYPTLKEAREGYLQRKKAQVRICTSKLELAWKALELAEQLVKEVD